MVVAHFSDSYASLPHHASLYPPLDFTHLPGEEIPTKHKEAICQLYGFAKIPVEVLATRYKLGRTTIEKCWRRIKQALHRRRR
jgi:hypothetical protein